MHRRQANVCLKGQGYCLVLNADGIYTASICALRLSYLLSKSCFHSSKRQCQPCMSQVAPNMLHLSLLLLSLVLSCSKKLSVMLDSRQMILLAYRHLSDIVFSKNMQFLL